MKKFAGYVQHLYHINLYHGQSSLKWTKMNRETNFCLTCWKQWARWWASFILINFPHSCAESLRPVTNDSCLINNWTAWDTPRVIKVPAAWLCLSTVIRESSELVVGHSLLEKDCHASSSFWVYEKKLVLDILGSRKRNQLLKH